MFTTSYLVRLAGRRIARSNRSTTSVMVLQNNRWVRKKSKQTGPTIGRYGLPGISWTSEQWAILETLPYPPTTNVALGGYSGEDDAASSLAHGTGMGEMNRITAPAAAGKTTILVALAFKAAELGYVSISYLAFNRAAARDGKKRLDAALLPIEAHTFHSLAHQLLNVHLLREGAPLQEKLDEEGVKALISKECKEDIDSYLVTCFGSIEQLAITDKQKKSKKVGARKQVEFFIYKSLMQFCRGKLTREQFGDPSTFGRNYYPAELFHKPDGDGAGMGFCCAAYGSENQYRFYADQACKLWDIVEEGNIRSNDFDMKRVALLGLRIPAQLVLVDESQDLDQCQADWLPRQASQFGTHVYMVGDPPQPIYGFRGAKPQYLAELPADRDMKLTETWRFGDKICSIANIILFAKSNSPQTVKHPRGPRKGLDKYWTPYRVKVAKDAHCIVTQDSLISSWRSQQVTLIARANVSLIFCALPLLGYGGPEDGGEVEDPLVQANLDPEETEFARELTSRDEPTEDANDIDDFDGDANDEVACIDLTEFPVELPKIHINGRGGGSGLELWKPALERIEAIYNLSERSGLGGDPMTLPKNHFPEFADVEVTLESFRLDCERRDLSKYKMVLDIVEKLGSRTMEAVKLFRERVIERPFDEDEADIILTTCHSAKGMEWDHVQVCNDFNDGFSYKQRTEERGEEASSSQRSRPEWEFDFPPRGDSLNLLYVACTRAKRTLAVPSSIVRLLQDLDDLHKWKMGGSIPDRQPSLKRKVRKVRGLDVYEDLSSQDAAHVYEDLVLPLRNELELEEDQAMMDELIGPHGNSRREQYPVRVVTPEKE